MPKRTRQSLHPVHAALLAGSLPLFLGALLSDWAYSSTYEVQWINFAAWLIPGALLLVGMALLWSVIDFLRSDVQRHNVSWLFLGALAATFILGFVNALVHGKDAWATMPAGLILSVLTFATAVASAWLGLSSDREGAIR